MNCNISCSQLGNLLRISNKGRLSVEFLCIEMTGNVNAGRMLFKLLYWWQRQPNGEVYKSWRDWWEECHLTRSQQRGTTAALRAAGVDVTVEKKKTVAPTNHYKLKFPRFLRRLIKVTGLTARQVMHFLRNSRSQQSESSAVNCADGVQSLTTDSATTPQQQKRVCSSANTLPGENLGTGAESAAPALEGKDIEPVPAVARQLFNATQARLYTNKYGADRVAAVCRYALNPPTSIRNPAGWAVDALQRGYILDKPKADYSTYTSSVQHSFQSSDDETAEVTEESTTDNNIISREPEAQPACTSAVTVSQAALTAWETAYDHLALQFDRATFDLCLRGARLVEQVGDVWRIGVRNAHARDMLQHRLYRNMDRMLSGVVGHAVTLEFVAEGGQVHAS